MPEINKPLLGLVLAFCPLLLITFYGFTFPFSICLLALGAWARVQIKDKDNPISLIVAGLGGALFAWTFATNCIASMKIAELRNYAITRLSDLNYYAPGASEKLEQNLNAVLECQKDVSFLWSKVTIDAYVEVFAKPLSAFSELAHPNRTLTCAKLVRELAEADPAANIKIKEILMIDQ